jgi:hypothetical protein
MTPLRFVPFILLMSASSLGFAQSTRYVSTDDIAPSEAQVAFDKLKTLAGSWVGPLTTVPEEPSVAGKFGQLSLRETSRGNALVHEVSVAGLPDHPVSMFYLEGDRLLLTHYCDAGNRPRMVGKLSPDGKTLEFDFLDVSGSTEPGHMHHATFTFIDENHHTEEWTYMMPGDKPMRGRFELQRMNVGSNSSVQ